MRNRDFFILKWNPNISALTASDFAMIVENFASKRKPMDFNWSIFDAEKLKRGDLFIMQKVGTDDDRIVMAGKFVSDCYQDKSWKNGDKPVSYANLDILFAGDDCFPAAEFERKYPEIDWHKGHSGVWIPAATANRIMKDVSDFLQRQCIWDEDLFATSESNDLVESLYKSLRNCDNSYDDERQLLNLLGECIRKDVEVASPVDDKKLQVPYSKYFNNEGMYLVQLVADDNQLAVLTENGEAVMIGVAPILKFFRDSKKWFNFNGFFFFDTEKIITPLMIDIALYSKPSSHCEYIFPSGKVDDFIADCYFTAWEGEWSYKMKENNACYATYHLVNDWNICSHNFLISVAACLDFARHNGFRSVVFVSFCIHFDIVLAQAVSSWIDDNRNYAMGIYIAIDYGKNRIFQPL